MKNYIRIIPPLMLAASLIYGCSASPKEDQSARNNQEAYSDSSAQLPTDSSMVRNEIPPKMTDSLRHLQTKVPVDRQIKDEDPMPQKTETPKIEPQLPVAKQELKKEVAKKGIYAVQLGAFSSDKNASDFALTAKGKLGENLIVKFNPETGLFVVRYGEFETRTGAEKAVKNLKKKNFKDAFIVTTK